MADPALQEAAHNRARDHDLRVGQLVSDLPPIALDLDQAGGAQQSQVLARIGLTDAETLGDAPHLHRPIREQVEHLQPARIGEDAQHAGLHLVDRFHGSSYRHMRICAYVANGA